MSSDTYLAEQKETRDMWLTPSDVALIEKGVRKRSFSFQTEQEIRNSVQAELDRMARLIRDSGNVLPRWVAIGVQEVSEDTMGTVKLPKLNSWTPEDVRQAQAVFLERLVANETEAAEEDYKIDTELNASVRNWLTASPYVVFCFMQYVERAAMEAARDEAADMYWTGKASASMATATQKAAVQWVKEWKKGTIL